MCSTECKNKINYPVKYFHLFKTSDEQNERRDFGLERPDLQIPRPSLGDLLKSMFQVHQTFEMSRSKFNGKTRLLLILCS
jgi:hypothetical protein